jgi:hypothetical protein
VESEWCPRPTGCAVVPQVGGSVPCDGALGQWDMRWRIELAAACLAVAPLADGSGTCGGSGGRNGREAEAEAEHL